MPEKAGPATAPATASKQAPAAAHPPPVRAAPEPAASTATPVLQSPPTYRQLGGVTVHDPSPHRGDAVADLVGELAPRLGLGDALDVHLDARAERELAGGDARGAAHGSAIYLRPGAFDPRSHDGRYLVAHELAHVAQARIPAGDGATRASAEAEARSIGLAAAAGIGFARPIAPLAGAGPAYDNGEKKEVQEQATSLTISISKTGKGAQFTVVSTFGRTLTASGSIIGLGPGDYFTYSSGGAIMKITDDNGGSVDGRFDIGSSAANLDAIRALSNTHRRIPMHVGVGIPQAGGGAGGGTAADPDRAEFEAMPDYVKSFLLSDSKDPNAKKVSYSQLLKLARIVADLSEEDLAEFKARTRGETKDNSLFEQSLEQWAAHVKRRATAQQEQELATQALMGLDEVYELFRSWNLYAGGVFSPPSWITTWEGTDTAALPENPDGDLNKVYVRMRKTLAAHNYNNLAAFVAAIQRFEKAFQNSSYLLALELLDKFEHGLLEQRERNTFSTATALHERLAPARKTFADAEAYKAAAGAQTNDPLDPTGPMKYMAAGAEYQKQQATGRGQALAVAGDLPVLGAQGFPIDDVITAKSGSAIKKIVEDFIADRIEKIGKTRERLVKEPGLVFRLPPVVAQAKARQGIADNTIWDKIIKDHDAPTIDDIGLGVMLAVFTLAVGILSGGSLLAAGVSLGLGVIGAVETYQEYALKHDAYGAQLLADDPWVGWVVIAVVGVGLDVAGVSAMIKPIRPALQEFNAGKIGIEELEKRLSGVEEKFRKAILARAEIELQASKGFKSLLPGGGNAMYATLGIDLLIGSIAYSVYINVRRGINTFNKWKLTREAADIVGDFTKLTPKQLATLQAGFNSALTDVQRIATQARKMGMPQAEIDAAMLAWAKRPGVTADDLIAELAKREVVIDRINSTGKITRSSIPAGHKGAVRVEKPNGMFILMEPLDDLDRATGVVAKVDDAALKTATGASASGDIPGRDMNQDRGHLLAKILGGPDLPHNLVPLLNTVNQRDMRMAEVAIRNAIRDGGEATIVARPVYKQGRIDPEHVDLTVTWKDGKVEKFQFKNPELD